jgi:hypothetical protein
LVVADLKVRHRFQMYRAPAVHESKEKPLLKNVAVRLYGNLDLQHTPSYCRYVAKQYKISPMFGADSFTNTVSDSDGMFITKVIKSGFGLSKEVTRLISSDQVPAKPGSRNYVPEPQFWVHYDEQTDEVKVSKDKPRNPGEPLTLNLALDKAVPRQLVVAQSLLAGQDTGDSLPSSLEMEDPFG